MPLAARRGVNASTDSTEALGRILNLVEDHRRLDFVNECTRISAHSSEDVGILKQAVRRTWENLPQQGRLP